MNNFKFNKGLLSLSFDIYGRYRLIAELIQTLRAKERLRILDVGGNIDATHYSVLKKFLPNDHVIVVDKTRNNYKGYIKADALNLPFGQGEFDFVISSDVLEHIPQDNRERFLEEQLRVAKQGILLAAPFFSKDVIEAERVAAAFYRSLSGKNHRWLSEHKKFVLPQVSWFEPFLVKHRFYFKKFSHNYIPYWIYMICVHFYTGFNDSEIKRLNLINKFYNSVVFPYDGKDPVYRHVYLITKKKSSKKIERIKSSKSDNNFLPQIQQMVFKLIGYSSQSLINDSFALKQIFNSRGWKFISFVHKLRIKIPILKSL